MSNCDKVKIIMNNLFNKDNLPLIVPIIILFIILAICVYFDIDVDINADEVRSNIIFNYLITK